MPGKVVFEAILSLRPVPGRGWCRRNSLLAILNLALICASAFSLLLVLFFKEAILMAQGNDCSIRHYFCQCCSGLLFWFMCCFHVAFTSCQGMMLLGALMRMRVCRETHEQLHTQTHARIRKYFHPQDYIHRSESKL